MLPTVRGSPSYPRGWEAAGASGMKAGARAQPGRSCSEGPGATWAFSSDLTPDLCSQRAAVPAPLAGKQRWTEHPWGSSEREAGDGRVGCSEGPRSGWQHREVPEEHAAGRGPARHPLTLSLSLFFLSVPLCRSACYIPPFLHIFLLGFRVHSLEIRFTVK